MHERFSIDELEEIVFETWGKSAEDLNLEYTNKNNFIMRIILYSLESGRQKRLVGVLAQHRDFIQWPEFD